tara:strand:+ start:397 stop:642 length:246 start_codon:yes stop_codon:yes gene_type:complete
VDSLLLALFLAGFMRWGNHLEYCPGGEYICPSYCEINHIHFEEDCNETQKKQKAYKQGLSESDPRRTVQADGDSVSAKRTY